MLKRMSLSPKDALSMREPFDELRCGGCSMRLSARGRELGARADRIARAQEERASVTCASRR